MFEDELFCRLLTQVSVMRLPVRFNSHDSGTGDCPLLIFNR
jgi:hypothetical protein